MDNINRQQNSSTGEKVRTFKSTIPRRSLPMANARPSSGPSNQKFQRPQSRPQIPKRSSVSTSPQQPIPRKSSVNKMPPLSVYNSDYKKTNRIHSLPKKRSQMIRVLSEQPFVIVVKTYGVPMSKGIPRHRSSDRSKSKRKRPMYTDLEDTDSDDFLQDSGDDFNDRIEDTRRLKKLKKLKAPINEQSIAASSGIPVESATSTIHTAAVIDQIDSPPPSVLPSLWYSREQFLHVWVIEKIIGWRRRPLTKLEWKDPNAIKFIGQVEASGITTKAFAQENLWKDLNKRMEFSRINSPQCPMVMHLAAKKEAYNAKKEERLPNYVIAQHDDDSTEEVLLVKWRGRSYMHCSWERKKDLEKFDQSNNTARGKIRRYFQSQQLAHGKNWKILLNTERTTPTDDSSPNSDDELFSPQYLEVERLLACDESEMDIKIFAKQRALNIRTEQKLMKQRELEEVNKNESGHKNVHTKHLFQDLPLLSEGEDPWDPEDFVRYVVKWKGMQYSEMTWEYWVHIKRDAVRDAEDFWQRQRAPSPEDIRKLPPHPHVKDFRKLTESPAFGISKMKRITADLGDGFKSEENDEDKEVQEFRLRSYQLEGVNWLLFNWWNRRSCILADEMGLGKTIQSTGFLHQLHELPQTQIRGPFLIVAPLTLIGQWQSESQTWAPDLNVVFYHGSADAREFLTQQEFFYTEQFLPKQTAAKLKKLHVTKFHILITTYEVVLKDVEVLRKIRWKALIVDEAHRLKNPKSRLFAELASVPRDFCLLLTGTPLQNSTEELWALLHFSDPITFQSKEDFVEKFGELSDSKQVSELHAVLKPYLLRRVKEDVEKSLPPKEETILEVTLTPIQKTYYKAIYEKNTAFLFKGAKPSNAPSLMNVMMELRKACNHPFLIRGAEDRIVQDAIAGKKEKIDELGDVPMVEPLKVYGEQLIKSSGKFVLLAKLLPKLYTGDHKVLIFSQMVRVLDLLEELLRWKKYRYERLDGSTNATARVAAVDRFKRKACQRFVMLLSTRAGGLGLNLTTADCVIIFDSDWNPQNDLQAMARSHRIGQTRPVRVYRLLTAKTYEMHMFHSASMKLGLDRAVLAHQRQQEEDGDGISKKTDKQVQAKEIDELLKKGAYDVFRDDDDKEAQKFMETDIDQLLEQSSKKVTYGKANNSISSGLGSFSKASFVADIGDGGKDVDLDDPDFWEKAVGLDVPVETPEEVAQMLDDGVKRNRKQVQQYDPYADIHEAEQKKKDKIAQKIKEEKEEKERLRLEKRLKKIEDKEKRRKTKEDAKIRSSIPPAPIELKEEKPIRELKPKKVKKSERSKAQRRTENEDPTLERLKQAWDIPQRNRASSALLRFGFGRLCKIRSDSNYTSLSLQDIEIFVRAYIYQIALQVAVSLLDNLKKWSTNSSRKLNDIAQSELCDVVRFWLGNNSEKEVSWICESVCSVTALQVEVFTCRRFLRMPVSLACSTYVTEMRKGPALRALRRLGLLDRLNSIMNNVIDEITSTLGNEEMGRRGCLIKDYNTIDADLKARHITSEELGLALGARLLKNEEEHRMPAVWWDRSCDLALLVGTFVHGLGNYEAMKNDEDLPFSKLIDVWARKDTGASQAFNSFVISTMIARKVFDEALESSKAKAQLEAHAAVAAAVAATKKAQAEGATDEPIKDATAGVTAAVNSLDVEADDLHMVTLTRLNREITSTLRKAVRGEVIRGIELKTKAGQSLPMPDPRVLDTRLAELIELIESRVIPPRKPQQLDSNLVVENPNEIKTLNEILDKSRSIFNLKSGAFGRDFFGLGFSGNQCGSSHRSLDDGSDYAVGSASTDLNFVATGNDGPRYLRALGVPINFTRYAIVSTVHADTKTVENMLKNEINRNFGKKKLEKEKVAGDWKKKNTRNESDITKEVDQEVLDVIPPIIPEDLILPTIRKNAKLRASICVVALHYGCPIGSLGNSFIDDFIVHALQQHTPYSEAVSSMFTMTTFCELVKNISGNDEMPSEVSICHYLESILLPHCLKLSVYGNGPTTRQTRVSKGKFETALGISLYPEPFSQPQSPIPDPIYGAFDHSIEAVLYSAAILRRVRLIRAAQYVVSGAISLDQLNGIFLSPLLCNSMDGLPLWWNPPIHDLALLVSVASGGIFNVLANRFGTVFDKKTGVIEEQIDSLAESLPGTDEEIRQWSRMQCSKFPSANVVERRLALICSEATKNLDNQMCYDHIPMFDHGGWPRN